MKIAYVCTLTRGGPVAHLEGLVPYFVAAGADVSIVVATDELAARFEEIGARARVIAIKDKSDLAGALRLWPEVGKVDIVHSHDRRAGLFARSLGRIRGARVVHTMHGLPEDIAPYVGPPGATSPRPISRHRRWWLESVYLRVEATLAALGLVVTPSWAMKRYLIDAGMKNDRIAVVPSCVPIRRRESPHLGAPTTIGTLANLEWWKGIDTLILALAQTGRPVHLHVFGEGSQRGALQKLASAYQVDATFHGHVADAADHLGFLDIFVLPSRAENFPIALLEAMSWALPSVATRVGGVPEIVESGKNGVLVPPGDVDALGSALLHLMANPGWAREMGSVAASRVADRYDPEQGGLAMAEVYRALCASST